jgi:DNA polymerase III gamma/tau subunit
MPEVPDHFKKRYEKGVADFTDKDIIHILHILTDSESQIKYSFFPELSLEMILLKIAFKPSSIQIEKLLEYLKQTSTSSLNAEPDKGKVKDQSVPEQKTGLTNQTTDHPRKNQLSQSDRSSMSSKSNKNKNGFQGLEVTLKNIEQFNNTDLSKKEDKPLHIKWDLHDIKAKWSEIVNKVRSQKVALGSFLEEGVPYAAEKNRLVIAYDNSAAFHQEHVEKNRKVIENVLKQDFKLPLQIGFKSIDFKSEGIKKKPRTPEEIVEDIKNKEPIMKKIIDVFGLDESLSNS